MARCSVSLDGVPYRRNKTDAVFVPVLGRRGLGLLRRLRRIEPPVALFDAAGSFVPGDGDADMVGANPVACRGDFLLRLAVCQGKDLVAEARRGRSASR
jgi:hypothetical protein